MADKSPPQDDLSIEEILGSIRRIIAEDDDAPEKSIEKTPVPADDEDEEEPLELTNKIEEDGSITDMSRPEPDQTSDKPFIIEDMSPEPEKDIVSAGPERSVLPASLPERTIADSLAAAQETNRMTRQEDEFVSPDNLLSSTTAEATSAVMAKLARHTAIAEQSSGGTGGVTIEHMVRDMLRPLLREWLDSHLPGMVQTMVERELEKLTKRL